MDNGIRSIRSRQSRITFGPDRILRLIPDADLEMGMEDVREYVRIYKELGLGPDNKVLQIIVTEGNVSMSKEARDFSAERAGDYFRASAIISSSLSVRLIVNFFSKFHKNMKVPMKIFENEEKALEWLKQFR